MKALAALLALLMAASIALAETLPDVTFHTRTAEDWPAYADSLLAFDWDLSEAEYTEMCLTEDGFYADSIEVIYGHIDGCAYGYMASWMTPDGTSAGLLKGFVDECASDADPLSFMEDGAHVAELLREDSEIRLERSEIYCSDHWQEDMPQWTEEYYLFEIVNPLPKGRDVHEVLIALSCSYEESSGGSSKLFSHVTD